MSHRTAVRSPASGSARRRLSCSIAVIVALSLGGCAGSGLDLPELAQSGDASSATASGKIETGSLPPVAGEAQQSEAPKASDSAAVTKARSLREAGDKVAAMTLLDEASAKNPDDKALLAERGLLALDLGRIGEARKLLTAANASDKPDWRIKSALGSALAASGDHAGAAKEFAAALKLAPEHPSILNNMALSHALEGRHEEAEKLLRRVASARQGGDRAKQNLALILGLSGKIDEAREVSEAALPKPVAAANVSYLERLRSGTRISRARPETDGDNAAETTLGALDNRNR